MKHIVDLDALKDCLDLMMKPCCVNGRDTVYVDDVKILIDAFPKKEVKEEI